MPARQRDQWHTPLGSSSGLCGQSETDSDDDDSLITCMRTTLDTSGMPVPVLLLQHFLQLPPCKSETVYDLGKLY